MIDGWSEMALTSRIADDGDSTSETDVRSRDGMTSASIETGGFSPRCLSLDLEVGVRDRRIGALIRGRDAMFRIGFAIARRWPPRLYDAQPSTRRHK